MADTIGRTLSPSQKYRSSSHRVPLPMNLHSLVGSPPRAVLPTLLVLVSFAAGGAGGSRTSSASSTPPSSNSTDPSERTVVVDGGTFTTVSPRRLTGMLAAKDFVLINVHVPYEGDIDGTDLSIPYDQVANRIGELPTAKDAKIFVYCRTGRMSAIAANTLVGLGYANVWELDGGMIAWEAAGYELVQQPPA